MRHLSVPIVMVLLLVQIISPMVWLPTEAKHEDPGMSIDLFYPSFLELQTPFNSTKKITFWSNLSVYNPENKTIDVELEASADSGWPVENSPKVARFNTTGILQVKMIVTVPMNVTEAMDVQVHMRASATYPNDTMECIAMGYIRVLQFHSVALTAQLMKKSQNENRYLLNVTNTGNGRDHLNIEVENSNELDRAQISYIISTPFMFLKGGANASVTMKFEYYGEVFPKKTKAIVKVRSQAALNDGSEPSEWTIELALSYTRPDTTAQNYIFAGVISAFIIVMVVVMAFVLRGPGKDK